MRLKGDIPRDTVFKLSYTAGVSNPAGAKLAVRAGADSVNPVSDLTLPMLAAIRRSVKVPLDIVTIAAEQNLGSVNRFWEGAEIIRDCAPCYFKQEFGPGVDGARLKVKYCEIMKELVGRLNPRLRMSDWGPADLCLPALPRQADEAANTGAPAHLDRHRSERTGDFSAEKPQVGISEMARLLGKKVSTIHRTVTVLKNRGYIEQDLERGKYRLGLKAFELGCVCQNQSDVMKEAMQRLESLARSTNETINLAVLDQGMKEVAYTAKIDSPHVLKTDIQIGTKLYAHCTALGKVLLAHLDREQLDTLFPPHVALATYTPKSLSNTDQLRRKLADVRRDGYALDVEEFRNGVVCIAMPYRDMSKRVVAAISVTAPAFRMPPQRIDEIEKAMFELLGA